MSLTFKPAYSNRPMYCAAYFVVGDELRPERPKHCIFCADSSDCHITIKAWRNRKVGIEHPLAVFVCRDHSVCFTAYPHGWGQYGRRPLVDVAPDGWHFGDDDTGGEDTGPGGENTGDDIGNDIGDDIGDDIDGTGDVVDWQGTAFGAAVDAAQGKRWPLTSGEILRSAEPKPYGVFATQLRHIAGVTELFRLNVQSDDKAREHVCARLPVSYSTLVASAARIRDGPSHDRWRREGREGVATTQKLTPPRRWLRHLLALGAALGFWGSPVYG